MNPIVRTYHYSDYNKIVQTDSVFHQEFGNYFIGYFSGKSYLCKVDEKGNVLQCNEYKLPKQKSIYFSKIVFDSQGVIHILAYNSNSQKRLTLFFFKLTPNGQVIKVSRVETPKIRRVRSLVLLPNNDLFLTGWYANPGSSNDEIFLLKINHNFSKVILRYTSIGNDTQVGSACVYQDSILVFASSQKNQRGIVLQLDEDLNLIHSFSLLPNEKSGIVRISDCKWNQKFKTVSILASGQKANAIRYPLLINFTIGDGQLKLERAQRVNYENTKLYPYKLHLDNNDGSYKILIHNGTRYEILESQQASNGNFCRAKFIDYENSGINALHNLEERFYYLGNTTKPDKSVNPLLIVSNLEMESCKTEKLEEYSIEEISVLVRKFTTKLQDADYNLTQIEVPQTEMGMVQQDQCPVEEPEPPFSLSPNHVIQSEAINLQVTGSTGEIATKGVLARWFLLGNLGNNHLPKGNMATTSEFYNKKNDFVNFYRLDYNSNSINTTKLDFINSPIIQFNHNDGIWIFKVGTQVFILKFKNLDAYQAIKNNINPRNNRAAFLENYSSNLYELRIYEDIAFRINVPLASSDVLKMETFSGNSYNNSISARKTLTQLDNKSITAENICKIEFCFTSGSPNSIDFLLYSSLIENIEKQKITKIGEYALPNINDPNVDNIVYSRLEKNTGDVHNRWMHYKENAKVNIENYKSRWYDNSVSDDYCLKNGIIDYVQNSEVDPKAVTTFQYMDGNSADKSKMEVSLLDDLLLSSLNFHVARILGLGEIDKPREDREYIYFIEYTTNKDIEDYSIDVDPTQHIYFSIPITVNNQRDPLPIKLLPPKYGIDVNNATDSPLLLTDAQGYVPRINQRFIQVRAALNDNRLESTQFFYPNIEFQSSEFTLPVFYGLKHKKDAEPDWRTPDLAHDLKYKDSNNVFESAGVLFNPDNPNTAFVHPDEEEGKNDYLGWPVDIFSKAGAYSNIASSDETKFIKANTLIPPTNVKATYIQKETPLLFSTQFEQDLLDSITNSDPDELLFKVDFDYNYNEDKNYTSANKVGIFYRNQIAQNVIGSITSVEDIPSTNDLCKLYTSDYNYISQGKIVSPIIKLQDKGRFIGSMLAYNRNTYIVIDVISNNPDGTNPQIIVRKNEDRSSINTGSSQNQLAQSFHDIDVVSSEAFLLVENLSNKENWTNANSSQINQFDPIINLDNDSWVVHQDKYKIDDLNTEEYSVKGIWDTSTITDITPPPTSVSDPLPLYREYKIEFDNFKLAAHSQYEDAFATDNNIRKTVIWRGGTIRVNLASDTTDEFKKVTLKVNSIENIDNGQELVVYAIHDINHDNIKTGANIKVNFFPGYRVYFKSQSGIDFTSSKLLPAENEGSKYGIVGLTSMDSNTLDAGLNPYESSMGVPAMFFAREIIEPKKPKLPLGPLYATPPNYENKASYNITVEFEHKPYGLIPYRINSNKILQLLYKYSTVQEIKSILPRVKEDSYLEERWQDLLSFTHDGNGPFTEYPINEDGDMYAFPKPDSSLYIEFCKSGPSTKELLRQYITSNLLPIVEMPLIYQHIKNGNYVPQNKKQTITDKKGKALDPNDPNSGFDLAPMAKRYDGLHKVLFTDFTLDSNLSSENTFFYAVAEMSNSMQLGEISEFLGPVQLVNTNSPKELTIKKVYAPIPSYYDNMDVQVCIEIDKIEKNQDLTQIEILRTTSRLDATNPRNMVMVKTIDLKTLGEDIFIAPFEVVDDFEFELNNNIHIPYSEPLFYRFRGVRDIYYKDPNGVDKKQRVYSEPSKVFITNVVDMIEPEPPKIDLLPGSLIESPEAYTDFILKWNQVCYKGTYLLQYLNQSNNWENIYEITSNEVNDLEYTFSGVNFPKENDVQEKIYHKFRMEVTNTSGLINKTYKIFVLPVG